jgi:hypothetical protein
VQRDTDGAESLEQAFSAGALKPAPKCPLVDWHAAAITGCGRVNPFVMQVLCKVIQTQASTVHAFLSNAL